MKKRVLSIILTAMIAVQGIIPVMAEIEDLDEFVVEESVEEENGSEGIPEEIISEEEEIILDESEDLTATDEEQDIEEVTEFSEEDPLLQEELSDESDLIVSDDIISEEIVVESENSEVTVFDAVSEDSPTEEEILNELSSGDIEQVGTVVDSGTCGDNLTWTLTDDGTLTISGTGDMWDWNYNGYSNSPWYYDLSIKKVVIESGVTSIGNYSFYNCTNLTSVTIPDSVMSVGNDAFGLFIEELVTGQGGVNYGWGNNIHLKTVVLSESVTSIGDRTFEYCSSLTSVTIPDSVTSVGDFAFYYCTSLTSVTIPDSVTSIGSYAFEDCSNLKSVTIGNGVTSIRDSAFRDCDSLKSVTMGNSVTSIEDWTFYNCSSLTSVTIPDGVTSIGDYAFYKCTSLTSVTIPDSVTSIEWGAFEYCTSLTSVMIGDSVTSIGDSAFYNCSNLKSVTIPNSVTVIKEWAFKNCTSLTDVYYAGSKKEWKLIDIESSNEHLQNATIHYSVENGFELNRDTWNFKNPTSLISVDKYKMFFKNASKAKSLQKEDNGSKGHCSGMVLAASSAFQGYPSKPFWGNKNNLWDVNKLDYSTETGCTAIDFIDYAHIFQYTTGFEKEASKHISRSGNLSALNDLRDAVYNFERNFEKPVWIGIGIGPLGKIWGHALLGYEISEETDTETKISIYDCNLPGKDCYIVLEGKYGRYTGCRYEMSNWNISMEDAEITYVVLQTPKFINEFDTNYAEGYSLLKINEMINGSIILLSSAPILIKLLYFLENSDDIIPIFQSFGAGESENDCYWIKSGAPVSFTDLSGEGEISLAEGDLEIRVEPAEGSNLTLDIAKGEVDFSETDGSTVNVTYELSSDFENSTITTIHGISDGNTVTTQDSEGNVIFTGLENTDIILEAAHENNDGTTSIIKLDEKSLSDLDPAKKYKVWEIGQNTSARLEVYEDKDGDGTFETPLTSEPTIKLSEEKISLLPGQSQEISVSDLIIGDEVVSWSSKDESIATVNNGTVKAIKAGSTTVTVTLLSGLTADVNVTVLKPTIKLSAIEVKLFPKASQTITVSELAAGDKIVSWKSGNTSIATVSDGKITAKSSGSTTVTVSLLSGLTGTVNVTVLKPTIKLSPTSITLDVNKSQQITVSNLVTGDKVAKWTSANTSIATVNSSGSITGRKAGTTTVTVTLLSGLTATVTVTVKEALKQPTLIAAYNGAKGIGVKFIKEPNADSYVIYRKENGVWGSIATVKASDSSLQVSGNTLMYTDTSVAKSYGKGFIYSVAAKKGNTTTTYNTVGVAIYRLNPPTLTKATNSAAGTATVTWKGVFGSTETNGNYDLQFAEIVNGKAGTFNSVITKPGYKYNVLKADVKGLKKGKTYAFRIRCSKTNKDRGTFYSEYSPWLKVTINK